MVGLLILVAAGEWQWHLVKICEVSGFGPLYCGFTDSKDRPGIIFLEGESLETLRWMSIWWKDSVWEIDTLPLYLMPGDGLSRKSARWFIGIDDSLWLAWTEEDTSLSALRTRFFHGLGDAWDTLPSIVHTWGDWDGAFFMDSTGVPSVLTYVSSVYAESLWVYRFSGGAWQVEHGSKPPDVGIIPYLGVDSKWHIHAMGFDSYNHLIHGSNETGSWAWEAVDSVVGGDFFWSTAMLFVDRKDQLHVLYNPYIYLWGRQKRYAFRDSLTEWHIDTPISLITGSGSVPVVDRDGIVHFAYGDGYPIFHWYRFPGAKNWQYESIGNTGSPHLSMLIDKQNYLHLFCLVYADGLVYYATTNPDIGVWEASPSEPRQNLMLSMAPSGFLISGYEGPIQVYDATGRLILSREIKGKTLIGPLNPGVYFVKAGRQRGRVMVLR